MPRADVRTPVLAGATDRVGTGRLYRKQVLRTGRVRYQGKDLDFTPDYLDQVVTAFRQRSHDTVPVMLADKTNDHTMAVADGGGEVLELERQGDELWATVRLSDAAARQVEANRKLGVSVRIKHDFEAGDGRRWPAAMQHLLLTWDPRVNGMKPWQQVELSDTDAGVPVLDLSDLDYETEGGAIVPNGNEAPQLTADEVAALRSLLNRAGDGTTGAQPPPTVPQVPGEAAQNLDDVDWDNMADDEVDRIIAAVLGDTGPGNGDEGDDPDGGDDGGQTEPQPQLAGAALSNPLEQDQLALANAQIAELQTNQRALTAQLDATAYERERDELARTTGLPPAVIDLARPLLEGASHTVELSNGQVADAGQIVRQLIGKVGETLRMLDLAEQFSARADAEVDAEQQQAADRRRELAGSVLSQMGLHHVNGVSQQPSAS